MMWAKVKSISRQYGKGQRLGLVLVIGADIASFSCGPFKDPILMTLNKKQREKIGYRMI